MVTQGKVSQILKDLTSSSDTESDVKDNSSAQSKSPSRRASGEAALIRAFEQRLISFTTARWFAKPVSMSPIVCAQYGWHCVDINQIQCTSCEEIIALSGEKSEEEYIISIQSKGHNPICKWASNPVPNSLAHKIEDVKSVLLCNAKKVMECTESNKKFKAEELFGVSNFSVPDYEEMDEQRSVLMESIRNITNNISCCDRILDLSMFGWKLKSESVISCDKCKRRARASNFKDKPFDPSKQHFYWCSWICSSYDDKESEPGWSRNLKANVRSPFKLNKSDVACEHGIESVKAVRTLFRAL